MYVLQVCDRTLSTCTIYSRTYKIIVNSHQRVFNLACPVHVLVCKAVDGSSYLGVHLRLSGKVANGCLQLFVKLVAHANYAEIRVRVTKVSMACVCVCACVCVGVCVWVGVCV